jgi:hypothetical protein
LLDLKTITLSRQSAQMAGRMSALRTSRDLLPRNINLLFLELIYVTDSLHQNEGLCKSNIYLLQWAQNPQLSVSLSLSLSVRACACVRACVCVGGCVWGVCVGGVCVLMVTKNQI